MNDAMVLVDIARHFSVLNDLAPVKVSFEGGRVAAEAMDGVCDWQSVAAAQLSGCNKRLTTVMCYGEFDIAVPTIASTVSIEDPLVLRQFADLLPDVVPQVTRWMGSCGESQLQVEFCGADGETAHAMLQSESYANAVVNVPVLRQKAPDVSLVPTIDAIKLMKRLANREKKDGVDRFWAIMNKRGRLFFSFDFKPGANQTAYFEMASGLPYGQLRPYSYDVTSVLKVLALADQASPVVMNFFNAGALVVDFVSAFEGRYKYVFVGDNELISDTQRALDLVKQLAQGNGEDASMYVDWEPDL